MNRRKAHQNEEGTNSNHRISISAIQDLMWARVGCKNRHGSDVKNYFVTIMIE
jgi:hypothetical protein